MTDAQHYTAARIATAIELRHAGSLRRDAARGILPRPAAISAIRDCLRHARRSGHTTPRAILPRRPTGDDGPGSSPGRGPRAA